MIWSALAGGSLFQACDERTQAVKQALETIALECQTTVSCVALAWILQVARQAHRSYGIKPRRRF